MNRLAITLLLLISLFGINDIAADEVYKKNKKANALVKKGKFDQALKLYEDAQLLSPDDKTVQVNKGSAQYRLDNFQDAERSFSSALNHENKDIRTTAHYNLGNALFRQGEQQLQAGDPQAQEKFKAALENYIKVLQTNPYDKDAKWNLQLAHKKIEQAQKQQQQNQNDKNENDKNKDQKNSDKNQNNHDNKQNDNQDNQQDQNNKEQSKPDDPQDKDSQQKKDQNKPEPTPENREDQAKKQEAMRMIMMYADDADSLNKPPKKSARQVQPEKDW